MTKYYLLEFANKEIRVKSTYIDIENFCACASRIGLEASYREDKDQTVIGKIKTKLL